MPWRRTAQTLLLFAIVWLCGLTASASEYHGQVTFNSLPVPGATVTATNGNQKLTAITNEQGAYSFPDLADGSWSIQVEMLCFATIKQDVTIASNQPAGKWDLKLLSLDEIKAQAKLIVSVTPAAAPLQAEATQQTKPRDAKTSEMAKPEAPQAPQSAPAQSTDQRASDGLLINGSVNNAATSQFALDRAFGNTRNGGRGLYNGGLALVVDSSALDARPFSLSGLDTPKANYTQVTGVATFGGPIRIPHFFYHGPNFFMVYQWMRNRTDTTQSALVPDVAERGGDFSHALDPQGQPLQIFNPLTGLPFENNEVPISPQAQALLDLYPLPNVTENSGNSIYNYQVPVLGNTHQDVLQTRLDKGIGRRDQLFGSFAFTSNRANGNSIFHFLDTTDTLGVDTNINWSHRLGHQMFLTSKYSFSRLRTLVRPYFANVENISGNANISGNSQDPRDWGPPSLNFSSGIASLTDAQSSFNRNETNSISSYVNWNHRNQYITAGGDFRRQQFNYLSQQNPRGSFAFTGASTQTTVNGVTTGGSDFADFLLGIPDTSAIAFGNADKYFRESVYDAYATDDWRLKPEFSINAGVRWEYGAPITELFNRLVNLDITNGFAAEVPVLASSPTGLLTRQNYPTSLIRPDKLGVEPRIGISWRPLAGSSIVVRAGYGIYQDTSVYQATALALAQQAPLSKSLSVQNSPACPLTLAQGFNPCSKTTQDTFAVDPNFRVGSAQTWQLSVQSDLPFSLQLTATYLGIKGTHGVQEFLPNTYPIGAANPCTSCPVGFTYRASNGSSSREAGMLQLRRRLRSGFTASLQYTYSKSIDDDSVLGGQGPVAASSTSSSQPSATIAQNWLDLRAERSLSTFDQRHLLNAQIQYTTGMGMRGGTLLDGWRGTLFKQWTLLTNIATGTGLPQTPVYFGTVPGTGVTGTIRPDLTGVSVHDAPSGLFLNPAAYTTPQTGQWGTAGRDSITGPNVFTLNTSMARAFRVRNRYDLDFQIVSTNLLNHVTYTNWYTTINSSEFGLPAAANQMRSLQSTLRLRF
ncbi:TonB-dependent receptor [Acidicapsa ligni]|uniref:TonB-dependent receptor n=1 Tax=Acidicapsa ligni TaxID=542300 RepID=UPI0021DF43FE|nr:carboxypeptidase-like regulatory domain-containing protein [Acidicapsa ligni]